MVPLERSSIIILSFFNFAGFDKYVPVLIAVVFLIILSAFFSLAETAYSSVNIVKLRNHMEGKRKGAKKAVYIAEKFDLTLTTIQVGSNLINITAITLFSYVITNVILNSVLAVIIIILLMLILIVIFGEMLPKSYSKENAEQVALNASGLLYFVIKILFPITWIFIKVKKLFNKKSSLFEPYVTEDELESIIDVMEYEGVIEKDNAELLQSAMSLSEISVYDIMTPRVDIVAVDVDDDNNVIKDIFFDNKYSRIPVYDDDIDNIVGILTERDFLTAYINLGPEKFNIKDIMIKPYYISKLTKVDELIREMQEMKIHLAIVSDEYGGTSGIVTMEDALEELVGEIYDETDEDIAADDPVRIEKIGENKYRVSAEMELEHLLDEFNIGDYPEIGYTSVGGFVYKLINDLSHEGQQVKYKLSQLTDSDNNEVEYFLLFTIDKICNRRIKELTAELISEVKEEIVEEKEL